MALPEQLPTDRWATVERLFLAAVELPPSEREAFIGAECGLDAALRHEVISLLRCDSGGEATLVDALRAEASHVVNREPAEGSVLGSWRTEREIGRGGMSVVYLGSRADGEFSKSVALKVIKRGMDTDLVIARMRRERGILASLDHPCISRLLDGGTTSDGLPWIAMEYVDGAPIDLYCEQHQLDIAQRCGLIIQVCEAVAYAHRNLIVHGDIKPGNILVGKDGNPRLLDFGIAKLLSPQAGESEETGPLTRGLPRPLTPEYASPEQLAGAPIGTATDVYSLGAVLYLLLTGVTPRAGAESASATALRASSSAVRKGVRWSARLRGDLDNILQMALRAEPERRYHSVDQLALDLRRHLEGLPVAARPDTLGYRAAKFVRRNRFGVAAAAALVLALTGGIAISTLEANRAGAAEKAALKESARAKVESSRAQTERDHALEAEKNANSARNTAIAERERADSEAATAKAVTDFLQNDLLGQASPNAQAGKGLTVREALDRAAGRIAGKFDGKPLVEADIRSTIGESYEGLGLYSEAQQQHQRAWELRRASLGDKNRDTLDALTSVAEMDRRLGKLDDAERLYNRILDAQRAEFGERDPATLLTMSDLAVVYSHRDQNALSEALNRKVLDIQREVLGPENIKTLLTMNNLGVDLTKLGKFDEAERIYRQVLEIRRRVQGPEHPNTIFTANNLAVVYARPGGNFAEAEKVYRETLEDQRRILGPDHPDTLLTMDNLGLLLVNQPGRYAEAEQVLKQSVEGRRRALGPSHMDTLGSQLAVAIAQISQHEFADAENTLRGTCDAYAAAKAEVWQRYRCQALLGASLVGQKRYGEAEPLLMAGYEGMRAREASIPANSVNNISNTAAWLARLYTEDGKPELALQWKGNPPPAHGTTSQASK